MHCDYNFNCTTVTALSTVKLYHFCKGNSNPLYLMFYLQIYLMFYLHKFHGQPSGLTIFAKIISGGKTKQTRFDDGIVVCLYLVQQKPYQHMFKQKYHKKWAKFLDSEFSWRDLMFFFMSTFCLELHLITISTCT